MQGNKSTASNKQKNRKNIGEPVNRTKSSVPLKGHSSNPTPPSKGVPPLDAFDHVRRLPPPNLPVRNKNIQAEPSTIQMPVSRKSKQRENAARSSAPPQKKDAAKQNRRGSSKNPIRKKTVRSPKYRRKRRALAMIAAVALLIIIGAALSVGVLFKIEKFEIQGEIIYNQQEMVTAFGHSVGENIFGFRAGNVAERMLQTLPYIEELSIQRRLPSTIVFRSVPAVETYVYPMSQGFAVLSGQLKVLRIAEEMPAGLTVIAGPDGVVANAGLPLVITDPQASQNLLLLIRAFQTLNVTEITSIDVREPTNLSFRWKDRFTVLLGSSIDLEKKLDFGFQVLEENETTEMTSVDKGSLNVSDYPNTMRVIYTPE